VRGYQIDVNAPLGVTLTDSSLDYVDQFGIVFHIALPSFMSLWNSNFYTMDRVIDVPASYCLLGGVEVIDGVFSEMGYIINEPGLQLLLTSGGGASVKYHHTLPNPPADYWSPFSA
jgi:hypothetical protein